MSPWMMSSGFFMEISEWVKIGASGELGAGWWWQGL